MAESLNYNEVMQFMKEFKVDLINRFDELIIDEPTNTYVGIGRCKDMEDVKTYVVYALCRPIGKGLDDTSATRLLNRVNSYFQTNLTKQDMRLMYNKLCSVSKLEEFKDFIKRGFPMQELED
ncbi:hypothetical protein CVD28_02025 [Bacillus sp. M6-12]|uniref:hypothetical protein n=1 Tax=Bacillus sp. M6-12 TaxID=2054166 RepID=UPI000C765E8D|nr:hypothetical protein [Bacillus sp. M6-12]PLS19210.1 hypothetical protein CVD28_02025 [Bacillus sp. M6-12]